VVGLGERECAQRLQPGHGRQPAPLLLLGAQHGDRAHREPGLHAHERGQAAVAARELHGDQARGQRVDVRAAVAFDAVADDADASELLDQGPWELGALPVVVDLGQHVLLDERAGAGEVVQLGRVNSVRSRK
jgi:hypothetical protein